MTNSTVPCTAHITVPSIPLTWHIEALNVTMSIRNHGNQTIFITACNTVESIILTCHCVALRVTVPIVDHFWQTGSCTFLLPFTVLVIKQTLEVVTLRVTFAVPNPLGRAAPS